MKYKVEFAEFHKIEIEAGSKKEAEEKAGNQEEKVIYNAGFPLQELSEALCRLPRDMWRVFVSPDRKRPQKGICERTETDQP